MKKESLGLLSAIVMLVIWGVITFLVNDAPGMTHALLVGGITLLIWSIVRRGAPADADRG